jgi:hypothetical protein
MPPASRVCGRRSRAALRATLLACALFSTAASAQVIRGGPLPGPPPLFPPDNWWNAEVSSAPLDPQSAAFINFIGNDALHPDFGGDDAENPPGIYGIPYVVVPGSQPLEPVEFVLYGDESDAGAPGRPPGYPIPIAARTQPQWIEGGEPGGGDDGDHHLLIVDRDRRLLYELFQAQWTGGHWEAGSGAVWPLDENRRRTEGWTSADAAGLAILPGLVRYDEVYESADPIRHAFRVTVRASSGYVFPASHEAGDAAGALPMGARLRLKASKDISGFAPPLRKIFQAMKTYGLIVADNGSDMYITGTYDPRWDNDLLNPAFAQLRAGDFEVVQRGWTPPATQPFACNANATTLCLNHDRFRVRATFKSSTGPQGNAKVEELTGDTGYLWFFAESNVEVILKLLDGCGANDRYWFFAGGLTDVEVKITVEDSTTGAKRTYSNPQGKAFQPVQDTSAFSSCP